MSGSESTVSLLALLHARPDRMTWSQIGAEVAIRGEARSLWLEYYPDGLYGVVDTNGHWARATAEVAAWRAANFAVHTVLDHLYPTALLEIHQMPPILFTRGDADLERRGVSVVGSRIASRDGLSMATELAEGLAERGLPVLSGLAGGIDTAAHVATVAAGGTPVGVLGTGILKAYPASNRDLHMQVASRGILVSQFLPDTPPHKHNFPMRNATMSGLGQATIVVEAEERSGARIQARVAVEHGRPVILTDRVVSATNWGKRLLERPSVFHADTAADALNYVEQMCLASESPSNENTAGSVLSLAL